MKIPPDNFTVTVANPGRIRVRWTDDDAEYWFVASYTGEELGDIQRGTYSRTEAVYAIPAAATNHRARVDAAADYADLINWARQHIKAESLIGAAITNKAQADQQRRDQRRADKARTVRNALAEVGALAALAALADDAALAEAYDIIQNSSY